MYKTQKFLVYRKKTEDEEPYYEKFEVPVKAGMSILDALFYIQDHLDGNFSFRYSCRGAICGSCGITIDKNPRLACKTQVLDVKKTKIPPKLPEIEFGLTEKWDIDKEILIEPLPNMTVLKDLVVDMEPFWNFYSEVKPFFVSEYKESQPETLQSPEDARAIEHLVYCILCGICWTCPVNGRKKDYLGPSALAKAYRFIADTRLDSTHKSTIVTRISREDGVPACEKLYVCNRVCPKNVRPGTAINDLRKQFVQQ